MSKKILKAVVILFSAALIVTIAVFANAFFGNPISKQIATNTAEKYLEEKYSGKDFELEKVFYNFKDGYYHAFIISPSSIDSHFTVMIDMWGKAESDSYESDVLTAWNTANRLSNEYREKVDAILNNQSFPHTVDIGFGDIEFIPMEYTNDPYVPEYALITEELALDKMYDINELASKAGKLTIYIDDKNVSYERMAEIILDIKRIFDNAGIKFYAMDFVLEYPKDENAAEKTESIRARDLLYTDIYEEGMVERVKQYNEAANAYYAGQDKEKSEQIN